jgi:ferredoxin
VHLLRAADPRAKIAQKVTAKDSNNIHVPDGVLRVACQNACPTEAITFGDISDPETEVSKAKANDRDYALLGYLNTRPRTTYLARLRNPNPNMPDYAKMPYSRTEYKKAAGYDKMRPAKPPPTMMVMAVTNSFPTFQGIQL